MAKAYTTMHPHRKPMAMLRMTFRKTSFDLWKNFFIKLLVSAKLPWWKSFWKEKFLRENLFRENFLPENFYPGKTSSAMGKLLKTFWENFFWSKLIETKSFCEKTFHRGKLIREKFLWGNFIS
ncbi:hypothetical protein [Faecalibaculum rodentium]|uniref:hypothetical protein n=1 Tax=Faecalibaculum rodentium TaxID=1702221 RepID=UPI0023EFB29B|nr:hypothetical protein [Faecalibaculum rodentium]